MASGWQGSSCKPLRQSKYSLPLSVQQQKMSLGQPTRKLVVDQKRADCEGRLRTCCAESLIMHQGGAEDERSVASAHVRTRFLKRWANVPQTCMVMCGAVWNCVGGRTGGTRRGKTFNTKDSPAINKPTRSKIGQLPRGRPAASGSGNECRLSVSDMMRIAPRKYEQTDVHALRLARSPDFNFFASPNSCLRTRFRVSAEQQV